MARPALATLRDRFDARRYNGAMFLGLNSVVVKSHGGTDGVAAIAVAAELVRKGTNERIIEEMGEQIPRPRPTPRAAAS